MLRPLPADDAAMVEALAVARHALTSGDVPVGAVVVDADGQIIGRGWNRREELADPTAHAEIIALREAAARHGDGWRLSDCTLVVTLEPCTMCAGAAVAARVQRLVFGAADDKAGAVGGLWDVVRDSRLPHRLEVVAGVRAEECSALLRDFFGALRNDDPGPVTNH